MADNCMEEKLQHGKHETQSNCITSGDHQISNLYINCLVMAALWNRAGHYIFAVVSFFFLSFFPRLISAVGDWMSTILPHMVWP